MSPETPRPGWRSRLGKSHVTSRNDIRGAGNINQSITAGRDANNNSLTAYPPPAADAIAEVHAKLNQFREALAQLPPGDDRDTAQRAADRIDEGLSDPPAHRSALESAADTIGLLGRATTMLATTAEAVQHAITALWH